MTAIDVLLGQVAGEDPIVAFRARRELAVLADRATDPAKGSDRQALASDLVAELTATVAPMKMQTNVPSAEDLRPVPKHTVAVRRLICQLLAPIAADEQVPGLASVSNDLEIRDAVRGVLQSIPTIVATRPLVEALSQVGVEFRVGVINALATERWRESVGALSKQAMDPDPEVRLAALEGLASFPEAASDQPIAAACRSGSPRERARAQRARVRLAETLRIAGDKESAATIYRSIAADPDDGPWKTAARLGLQQSG